MNDSRQASVRRVEPLARDWRHFEWAGGHFDTARRSYTALVEGTIRIPQYLLLATLQGGARTLSVRAECGHRYEGPERTGAISIVIPACERQLRLNGVSAQWASLAIDEDVLARGFDLNVDDLRRVGPRTCSSNLTDPFLFALLSEMERAHSEDGCLDLSYCEAMSFAAVLHLRRRHFAATNRQRDKSFGLPRWQVRKVEEYVEDHLDRPIRVGDLAHLTGYSEAYFHRAFQRTAGVTPLEFVHHRRIRRAVDILQAEPAVSTAELAHRVGYTSPNYFRRLFRRLTGMQPARLRGTGVR